MGRVITVNIFSIGRHTGEVTHKQLTSEEGHPHHTPLADANDNNNST